MRSLLDVNILIALAFASHQDHERAHEWFRREPNRLWASSPLTQAGFLRVASRLLGGSRDAVRRALAGLERDCRSAHHAYWPVDADLRDLSESARSKLIGPNQVTDMQLILSAHRRKGQLVTFDGGAGELAAATGYAKSVLVLD